MDIATTGVAALIGAIVGSLGAVWLGGRIQRRHEEERTRRKVAQNYLIQLQDALESLWHRLDNVNRNLSRQVLSDDYYAKSSIYAVGYALAQKRRMMLDGVYANLDLFGDGFATQLEECLEAVEKGIGREGPDSESFYRYQRLALAESILVWDGGWRTLSYHEFSTQTSESEREPALRFLARLGVGRANDILAALAKCVALLASATGISSAICTRS